MTVIKAVDHLPPLRQYVLVHAPGLSRLDRDDPEGLFWLVAKRVPCAYPQHGTNNRHDYYYSTFGPLKLNGQDVVAWSELPCAAADTPDERTKIVRYLECEATDWESGIAGHDATVAQVIDELAACVKRGAHLKGR